MKNNATIEFSKRLETACDGNPAVPEAGKGRQVALADKLKVSQEAVRKYFSADSRPKPSTMTELARILNVDEAWLALGHKPNTSAKEKRTFNKHANGATYATFGLFVMSEYACSFDDNAESADFHAIRSGVKLSIAVTVLREENHKLLATVKLSYKDNINVLVTIDDKTDLSFYVINSESITCHGDVKGGYVNIELNRTGNDYFIGTDKLTPLKDSNLI